MRENLSLKNLFRIVHAGMSGKARSRAALKMAERILTRQVESVLAITNTVVITNIVILALLVFALNNSANPRVLTLWAGFISLVLLAFVAMKRFYAAETARDSSRSRFWARTVEALSAIRALGWGIGVILFFPGSDPGIQLILGPTTAAIMFGGATALNAIPSAAMLFVTILGGSLFVALVVEGSASALVVAALTLVFIVYLLVTITNQARFFISHALAEFENSEQKQTIGLLLNELQENSSDWLWRTDASGWFVDPSPRFAAAAGRSQRELAGLSFDVLFAPKSCGLSTKAIDLFKRQEALNGQEVVLDINGRRAVWSLTARPHHDEDGAFVGFRGVASDVTELRAATEQLENLAHYDQMTGLVNRASFIAGLERAIESDGTSGVGIVLFDLTGFKQINDTLGHGVGDALLAELGARLKKLDGAHRQFARLGGDEFALLMRAQPTAAALAEAAEEALSLIAAPYVIDPHNVMIDASAGIALGGRDGAGVAELMRAADLALYAAKSTGRGSWREYDQAMDAAYMRRQKLESGLRQAIDNDELHLRFQPIVSVGTGVVSAFEALLRWRSPEFGDIGPDEFIPIAEESGMIVPIGDWVMRTAIEACMQLPHDSQICINVSPVQLRNREFFARVYDCLAEYGLAPERLVIEITEGVFLERSAQTDKVLGELVALGVQIALDDFGTGYSSLSYLRSFPFSKIKIDKSFIDDAAEGGPNASIVKASVDLARAFGFEIVVEGVETNAQLHELIRLGCDYFQGFLFSKPLLEDELPLYLASVAADPPKRVVVDAA